MPWNLISFKKFIYILTGRQQVTDYIMSENFSSRKLNHEQPNKQNIFDSFSNLHTAHICPEIVERTFISFHKV